MPLWVDLMVLFWLQIDADCVAQTLQSFYCILQGCSQFRMWATRTRCSASQGGSNSPHGLIRRQKLPHCVPL